MLFELAYFQFLTQTSCSITKSCPTLCDPIDCNTPGFPVFHYLPEFAQTHICWIGDAMQVILYYTILSHPLLPPFLFVLSFSQLQSLFQWVISSGGQSIGASASVYLLRHSFYVSNRWKIIFPQTHTRLKTMDIGQRVLYHPAFKEFI